MLWRKPVVNPLVQPGNEAVFPGAGRHRARRENARVRRIRCDAAGMGRLHQAFLWGITASCRSGVSGWPAPFGSHPDCPIQSSTKSGESWFRQFMCRSGHSRLKQGLQDNPRLRILHLSVKGGVNFIPEEP